MSSCEAAMLRRRDVLQGRGERLGVETDLHGDLAQRRLTHDVPAALVVRVLDAAQHRQGLVRIERLRGEHGGDHGARLEHEVGVEQQPVQVRLAVRLAAHLPHARVGLLNVTAHVLRQPRRLRPQAARMHAQREPVDFRCGPDERLRAVAPTAQRIVDVMQHRVHEARHLTPVNTARASAHRFTFASRGIAYHREA
jgi:hypothetical protein